MKNLFTFIFIVFSFSTFAQTPVSGNQSGVWAVSGSPFQVTGDVTVPTGESLSIEPGVVVDFQGHYKLTVNGSLQANGTESDSVFFTTDDPATGWHGIRLTESQNGSVFTFCHIEYGKTSGSNFPDQHGGGIMMNNSNAVIENCLFLNNDASANDNGMGGAIYGFNTSSETLIAECVFKNNNSYGEGGAIKLTGDIGANILNCSFIDNTVLYGGGAICLYGCYDTHILRCLFTGNVTSYSSGGAVFIEGYSARIVFVNCTIYDNHATGGDGGAVEIAFSDASFTNSIIYNNPGAYSDNIFLDLGYAEINYCDTPLPDGAEGENNINTNPQFVDAPSGDFHLSETSPCIDAGIDSLTITTAFSEIITVVDMDSADYIGIAPDMGCFEYDPSTGMVSRLTENFTIYPNPTSGHIYFELPDVDVRGISITDLTGKVLFSSTEIPMNNSIDISEFDSGIYVVTIQISDIRLTSKVIKE